MTPAIELLRALGIEHSIEEYSHDPAHTSYGLEAAEALGLEVAARETFAHVSWEARKKGLPVHGSRSGSMVEMRTSRFAATRGCRRRGWLLASLMVSLRMDAQLIGNSRAAP